MKKTTLFRLLEKLLNRDKVVPQDELRIKMLPAIKVFCIHCHKHIFCLKYQNKPVTPANLAPLAGRPPPKNFDCPLCNRTCVAYSPAPTCKTDRGYIS